MARGRAKILESQDLFDGKAFGVRRERIAEPGGIVTTREIVTHKGSAVVLPVFPDGSILLIRQYRHAAGESLWELVAGHIEIGEEPAAGARRELLEETGYRARRVNKLLEFFPSPGFLTEKMWAFAATGLAPGPAQQEPDEKIISKRFSLAAAERMIRSGGLRDGKSIATILYYARFGK